ncbi:MAG: hypothetical protein M1608_09730 [Candidatus Omnitrophica bacterium]|nr:hypothetical protein [Candidatus Omnitrophota bacterium]
MPWPLIGYDRAVGYYRIKNHLRERIVFKHSNLLTSFPSKERFAIIFCRNVMIYFDRPTQEKLLSRLYDYLIPKGYLFIGHSESVPGLSVPLRCLYPSILQKE